MREKEKDITNEDKEKPLVVPQPYPVFVYPDEDKIDIKEIWDLFYANRVIVGKIFAIYIAIAIFLVFLLTPTYRAETLLAPVEQNDSNSLAALAGQFGGLAEIAGINIAGDNSTEESIATLKSRELTTAFIKEENILPVIYKSRWDSKKNIWKKPWFDFSDSQARPSDWDAYEYFDDSIRRVTVNRKTKLITVSIDWENPKLAAKWANGIVKKVNEVRRNEAIEDAKHSIEYLKEQLQKTSSLEVQRSIYKLIEAQTKSQMIASTQKEYAFKVLDKAVVPEEQLRPKLVIYILFALFLSFLTSAIVIILKNYFK